MFPRAAVVVVMDFPPDTLRTFIGNIPPSDFPDRISCYRFIITCSIDLFIERPSGISRVTVNSQHPTCHALQLHIMLIMST